MAVSSLTIITPVDQFTSALLQFATTVRFAGGVGPFDILYEWDTVNTFDSGNLITDSDTSVTSPHEGNPPSDMGPYGTEWFMRVTIEDRNDDTNEIQPIKNDATGGDFTLSFDGQGPTGAIAFDASAATVETALEGLSNIVDVSVSGTGDGIGVDEVQSIFNDASSGTFTLSFDGQGPSAAINFNDPASAIETALELFSNIADVTVTGAGTSGDPWIVTFNDPAATNVALITADDTGLVGGTTTIAEDTTGIIHDPWIVTFIDPGSQDVAMITADDTGLTGETVGTTIAEDTKGVDAVGIIAPAGGNYTLNFVDPVDYIRYLYVTHNVGVAFGPGLPDGDPIEFDRYLYLFHNVTSDQPCPWVSSIAPSIQDQGGAVSIFGDGFGATQATYITEIRLYEDQDLSGSHVVMSAGSWSDDEISATIPGGATTGWLVLVQTNGSATCFSSEPKLLQVIQVPADPDAGWWLRTANKLNVHTEEDTVLPGNTIRTSFKKIMNAIGSGQMELPLGDPIIDQIIDPVTRQGVLVQSYIDGRMRYGWFAETLSHDYNEEGDAVAVISGRGMEVVALWNKVLPHDYPASPSKNPTWVYGSNENFIKNPGFEDDLDAALSNPGGEDGNDDDGNAEGWSSRGDDLDSITAIQDSLLARTDDWYIEVAASDNHSGMTQSVTVTPNRVYHVQAYVSDFIDSGMRVTLAVGGADDIAAIGVTYPNNFVFNNEILAELDNVASNGLGTPGGSTDGTWQVLDVEVLTGDEQTSMTITIHNDHHGGGGVFQDFGVDDVTIEGWGLGLEPWTAFDFDAHATNSFRLSTDGLPPSEHSCTINGLSSFAGIQQVFILNALTKYTFGAWMKQSGFTAGDSWTLEVRLNDGNETLIDADVDVVPVDGVWTNLSFVTEMPNLDEVEVILRMVYTGSNNPPPTQVDDFSAVPGEPASTAGKILNDILDKMALIGKLTYLTRTFTEEKDSRGQNWGSTLSLDIEPSESLYGVLSRLVALGHEWQIVPSDFPEGTTGFQLDVFIARAFNPDSGIGQDWTTMPEGPVIMPGDATVGGRIIKSVFGVNTVLAIGDDGNWSRVQQHPWNDIDMDPSDPADHGYDESFGQIEEVLSVSATDQTSISKFADARLADSKDRESALQLFMQRGSVMRPFLTFEVGDSIYVDLPPYNPDPPVDIGGGVFKRSIPKRVRSIQADLAGEGSDITFQVDIDRVIYENQLAWNAAIAQLSERAPSENTGQGTGSVSGGGGSVTVIGGGGSSSEVASHTHDLDSSEIKKKATSGDVSGTLPGKLSVNAIKGLPVDVTVPTEIEDTDTVMAYDYDTKVLGLVAGVSGVGGGGDFPLIGSWTFRTDTGSTPTAGRLTFDDTTTADVTSIYVNELDTLGHDRSLMFGELSDGDDVWIWEGADVDNLAHFTVDGNPSLASDVWTIPVLFVSSNGTTPWTQNRAIRLAFLVATSGGGGGGGGAGTTSEWQDWSPIVKAGASVIAGMDTGKFLVLAGITFWTIEGTASSGGTGDITITGQPPELIDARTFDSLNPWHVGDGRWENEGVLYDYVEIRAQADDIWDLRSVNGFNPFTTTVGLSPDDGFAASGFVVNSLTSEAFGVNATVMFDLLHSQKPSADTPDDEFNSETLDGKWTAVSGASGIVDLFETGEVEKYDLTTRPGWLLMQAGAASTQSVELLQDYTLGDGESIVAAVSISITDPENVSNNELLAGIGVNNNDAGFTSGLAFQVASELDDSQLNIKGFQSGTATYGSMENIEFGKIFFMRISRVGTVFHGFVSVDGTSWVQIGNLDMTANMPDNVWLFCAMDDATLEDPLPIQAVKWFRLGTNDLDPWNPVAAVAVSGGSGLPTDSWLANLFTRPSDESAHAYDDEFDDASIDAAWNNVSISGTLVAVEKAHVMSTKVDSGANASDFQGLLKPLDSLTSPLTVETCVRVRSDNGAGAGMIGVGFTDGIIGSSNLAFLRKWEGGNNGIQYGTLTNTDSSTTGTQVPSGPQNSYGHLYMRCIWSAANTFKIQVSIDGVFWSSYGVTSISKTMTPTHFGILHMGWSTAIDDLATFEYFRVTESDLSL